MELKGYHAIYKTHSLLVTEHALDNLRIRLKEAESPSRYFSLEDAKRDLLAWAISIFGAPYTEADKSPLWQDCRVDETGKII